MSDMFSILQSSYQTAALNTPSPGKYVNVDPDLYKGTWRAKYADGKPVTISVSEVNGFRARVKFEVRGQAPLFQQVLIKDNAFRIGDNKFFLQDNGKALIRSVVQSANGSQSLETTYATRD